MNMEQLAAFIEGREAAERYLECQHIQKVSGTALKEDLYLAANTDQEQGIIWQAGWKFKLKEEAGKL